VNEADPAPATNAPEAVGSSRKAAAAPRVAQGAGTSSKKGKAQGSETIKKGSGNGKGKGKQKGAQP